MTRVLGICGSLRKASKNMGLLRFVQGAGIDGLELEIADLSEVPLYNQDIRDRPAAVDRLVAQMASAEAFLFGCPEYNYSIAPALKNALDWGSREETSPFAGKAAAMLGAGGGMKTSRAQYHLRQVCVFLDLHVITKPEFFANAFAGAFDDAGTLTDEALQGRAKSTVEALLALSARLR